VIQITNLSFAFPEKNWRALRKLLEAQEVEVKPAPHGFQARFEDAIINWFTSEKLLLQGKGAADFAEELYARGWIKAAIAEEKEPRIGVDESGKGDFFGPLVIAGALVTLDDEYRLVRLGVRDSKTISGAVIGKTAWELERMLPYSKIVISPAKYNELHLKMHNVNRILAWGHARAIENLLEKHGAKLAISDQFGDESLVRKALMEKGKKVKLIQRHRAEEDLAVAAASIIARAEFLKKMDELSEKAGIILPRGVSDQVIAAGKKLVAKVGVDGLDDYAKTHFKTMQELIPK
jgi:ribonuclease HIII